MANNVDFLGNAGVVSFAVLPSAARTSSPDTMEYRDVRHARGIVVVVDVTASSGTPSVTVKVQGVDVVSGKTWDILTSAAITGTGTTVLRVRPGITAESNVAVADALPPNIRIAASHGENSSITYSVAAYLTQ